MAESKVKTALTLYYEAMKRYRVYYTNGYTETMGNNIIEAISKLSNIDNIIKVELL